MSEPNKWRPSGSLPGKFEYGQIGYPVRQGVYASELCDVVNALEAKLAAAGQVVAALEKLELLTKNLALLETATGGPRYDQSMWAKAHAIADAVLTAVREAGLSATRTDAPSCLVEHADAP